mmetsp:Transcript_46896/g.130620  ORF Transcript_46896/g.130620 Transcript_46896/m.130620 type:complete len:214 (+) Transcript_46896:252-893(+)
MYVPALALRLRPPPAASYMSVQPHARHPANSLVPPAFGGYLRWPPMAMRPAALNHRTNCTRCLPEDRGFVSFIRHARTGPLGTVARRRHRLCVDCLDRLWGVPRVGLLLERGLRRVPRRVRRGAVASVLLVLGVLVLLRRRQQLLLLGCKLLGGILLQLSELRLVRLPSRLSRLRCPPCRRLGGLGVRPANPPLRLHDLRAPELARAVATFGH